MTWVENPQLRARLLALAGEAEQRGAEAAADWVKNKLDHSGGGIKWPGLPNTSSAPGEFPAKQSGALVDSIRAGQVGQVWAFGSFNAPPEAFFLEYPRPGDKGARPWLSKALADPELREHVLHAMWEVMREL